MTTTTAGLPARPAYHVVSDTLHRRLRRAEERERSAQTVDEWEAATREVVEIWEAIDAHEAEGLELAAQEQWERERNP